MTRGAEETTTQRDATSLRILGTFFLVLGVLVLFATAWTLDNVRAAIVNVVGGVVLFGVGLAMRNVACRIGHKDEHPTS